MLTCSGWRPPTLCMTQIFRCSHRRQPNHAHNPEFAHRCCMRLISSEYAARHNTQRITECVRFHRGQFVNWFHQLVLNRAQRHLLVIPNGIGGSKVALNGRWSKPILIVIQYWLRFKAFQTHYRAWQARHYKSLISFIFADIRQFPDCPCFEPNTSTVI